jgi:TNF receptor-associated factor 4
MPIHLAHAVVYHLSKQTAAYEERLKLLEAENERLALRCKRLEAKHEELEQHVSWLSHVTETVPREDLNHHERDLYVNTSDLSAPHNQALYNPYLQWAPPPESSIGTIQASVRPTTLTMTNFEQHKRNDDDWISHPFYTHSQGYKMCLRVTANGQGSGKGTHIAVAVYLMKGEFDNQVEWPFRGDITIQLLNQREDGEDHTRIIHQAQGERGTGSGGAEKFISAWGINKFKAHSELYPMYVKHDSLKFRILILIKQSAEFLPETAV